jgi:hypothetical protein
MKRMNKWFLYAIPSTLVIVVGFSNCGRMGELKNGSANLSSQSVEEVIVDSEKLGLPYALLSAEQTLSSMMKVTNTTMASPATLNEYTSRYGALAAGNDLSMANAPLMLGATSLAGEVCNNLLAQEKALPAADRNFFGAVNFAAGLNSFNDNAYAMVVRGMARSFWGRSENTEEAALLSNFKNEFIMAVPAANIGDAAATSNLMLGTCAAMLSSVEAITY